MCQQITIVHMCGDTRTSFHRCAHALENDIMVMACPFYERETEEAADGDCSCSRCFEVARLRAEKSKRVCPSTREKMGLHVVQGPKTGGGTNPDYPTILEEEDEAEAEAEESGVEDKGKGIDRETHPNYPRASKEDEEDEEDENRPITRASQRERPVAEPRTTPLKSSKSKSLVGKMSDKVKRLARSISNKNGK
ncbi:787738ea-5fa7-4a7c-808f-1c008cf914b7-CDS [Sclerotinia trifoliorum]|uniref:787738ea-5fa7-4a7c-808f-1c008cf914b7-CDS n=1 Tax=Sclerotinia trifoliorum TaxID=28548 RepID=A0A8H2ZNX2_9HELO|nr:787738ea-5fa7-4a7c-808f-1c008cf914b7-CDS [Sclerotinia trifoliorum]